MSSKAEQAALDTSLMSNLICEEILREYTYGEELGNTLISSANKNLNKIDAMEEFSINMLKQIEQKEFKNNAKVTKAVSIDDKITQIQKETILDISKPIQNMFDEVTGFVCDALAS